MSYSIEPSFLFCNELTRLIVKAGTKVENQWFFVDGAFSSTVAVESKGFDSWNRENFVVVCEKKIIAYFEGVWERPLDIIMGVRVILFEKEYSLTMGRALLDYLNYLFVDRGCMVFNWSVAIKNKRAYEIYEKFTKRHCGHRVGIRSHAQKGYSGEISDIVLYEITREEFFHWKNKERELPLVSLDESKDMINPSIKN